MWRRIVFLTLSFGAACDNAPIKNEEPMLMLPDEPRGPVADSGVAESSGDTGVPAIGHPDAAAADAADASDAGVLSTGLDLTGVWAFEQITSQIVDGPLSG